MADRIVIENDPVTVTCYGIAKKMNRLDAIALYTARAYCSEGAEFIRYAHVLLDLYGGRKDPADEWDD